MFALRLIVLNVLKSFLDMFLNCACKITPPNNIFVMQCNRRLILRTPPPT